MATEAGPAHAPGVPAGEAPGSPLLGRRDFIKATVLVAAGAAVGSMATLSVLTMVEQRSPTASPLVLLETGRLITLDHFTDDAPQPLVGHWAQAQVPVVVYTVPVRVLEASSLLHGYNTGQHAIPHPTRAGLAIVAFDGRCTHLGCTVGWRGDAGTDYDGDGEPDGQSMCPCHLSHFDVYNLGRNHPRQPADRPLGVVRVRFQDHADAESGTTASTLFALERIPQRRPLAADRQGRGASFALAR